MKSRYAARADGNQPDIVDALRKAGCFVQPLHTVGQGVPDLLVGKGAVTYLIEVKDPTKPKSDQKLTERQHEWHADWRGRPVAVVYTAEDALAVIGMGVQPQPPCSGYDNGCRCPDCQIDAAEERREWHRNIRENHDCEDGE